MDHFRFRQLVTELARAALGKCETPSRRAALAPILERLRSLGFEQINDGMGCLGTPAQCRELLMSL